MLSMAGRHMLQAECDKKAKLLMHWLQHQLQFHDPNWCCHLLVCLACDLLL